MTQATPLSSLPEITKRCPDCGAKLMIRTNRQNDSHFIGCTTWPECTHTEPIPQSLHLRLEGAPELPLFDDAPTKIEHCHSCGAAIVWGTTAKGKACPFDLNADGTQGASHFTTCPDARGWSRK
jgi:ssDNA-binding Zn-finger/Zn-ribbon topoisomerase 1